MPSPRKAKLCFVLASLALLALVLIADHQRGLFLFSPRVRFSQEGGASVLIRLIDAKTRLPLRGRVTVAGKDVYLPHGELRAEGVGADLTQGFASAPAHWPRAFTLEPGEVRVELEPYAAQGRVVVPSIMYHELVDEVDEGTSEWSLKVETFAAHMRYLAEAGYRSVDPADLRRHVLEGTPLPEKPVLITFDDATRSQLKALPILKKHGLRAVFFVSTGLIQPAAETERTYMSWAEVRSLHSSGVGILGGHSRSHPRLDQQDAAALEDEVKGCMADLREHAPEANPTAFAYCFGGGGWPWRGHHGPSPRVQFALLQAGFTTGWADRKGPERLGAEVDLYSLRRVQAKLGDSVEDLVEKLAGRKPKPKK